MLSLEISKLIKIFEGKKIKEPQRYTPSFHLYYIARQLGTSALEGVFAAPTSLYHLGVGKTVYCLKTALYVYDKKWDIAKKYIVFMPQDFLTRFEDAIDNRYRIPLLIWDDAGFWIGRQRWQTKFVKAVREFMNVIRTHLVYLMINAPRYTEVARGIREQLTFVSFISFQRYFSDLEKRTSKAVMYHASDVERVYGRKKGGMPISEYIFRVYFPYYSDYEEMRGKYVQIGKERAQEALKEIAEEAAEEMNEVRKKFEPDAKLDNIVDEDELLEKLEEEADEYEEG